MCLMRKESPKSLLCGKRTIRVACLCLSAFLMVLLLLITLVFHLNHNRNKDSTTDDPSVRDRGEFSSKSCVFENGISIRIPQSVDFHMETVAKSSKDSSENFQTSMLQITKKLIHSLKVANNTAEKIDLLSSKVVDQLNYIHRSLDTFENPNSLFEFIEEPLKNVTQSTKKLAQYFLLTAQKFEQLFHLMKVVVHGSIGKKLIKLERSLNIVEGKMNSSVHSKQELEKAIESMTNSSIEAALRLQQNQDELEMATLELKSLRSRSNSANCFENWEWNWWPLTYTTTSTCFPGRPSDDDWANSKSRLENAKWKSNCSAQEVNEMQEKIQKWTKVDQDLSIFIEKLAKNKNNLHKKLAMFNGTSSESLVQMERETCKMTAGFTIIYDEAAAFFRDISSRISNSTILEPTTGNIAINSRSMPSDTFLELRSNLKKITNEALNRGAVYANIPKLIFRHNIVFRFQIEQLRQMRTQRTINSGSLVKLLANIRKSHLKRKSADGISQKCDELLLSIK